MSASSPTTAAEEVAQLELVLTKLAMTTEEALPKVLSKLLPLAVGKLSTPHASVEAKVMGILQHINKRVRASKTPLPLGDMLSLLQSATHSKVRSFALVYADMAFRRATAEEQLASLATVLRNIGSRAAQQRLMLLRMVVSALEAEGGASKRTYAPTETWQARAEPLIHSKADRAAFLAFAEDALLWQPPSTRVAGAGSPHNAAVVASLASAAVPRGGDVVAEGRAAAAQQVAAAAAQEAAEQRAAATPPSPHGLSSARAAAVHGAETPPARDVLKRRKLGLLALTVGADLPSVECLRLYLAAAGDPDADVAAYGDELLKKRLGGIGGAAAAVDAAPELTSSLMSLFLGDSETRAASPALRAVLLDRVFVRSIAAANCFPQVAEVAQACVAADAGPRLRQLGLELAAWVFKHAEEKHLQAAAPSMLSFTLAQVAEPPLASAGVEAATSSSSRSLAYTALGELARRAPAVFRSSSHIPELLFARLEDEPPGARAGVQGALGALVAAYGDLNPDDGVGASLFRLARRTASSPSPAARVIALQWLRSAFPFSCSAARLLCCMGRGDAKAEVAEEARLGLVSDDAPPTLDDFLHTALDMLPGFLSEDETHVPAELRVSSAAMVPLLAFARSCRRYHRSPPSNELATLCTKVLRMDLHSYEAHAAASSTLLELHGDAPDDFASSSASLIPLFETLLRHRSVSVRLASARMLANTLARSGMVPSSAVCALPCKARASEPEAAEGSAAALGLWLAVRHRLGMPWNADADTVASSLAEALSEDEKDAPFASFERRAYAAWAVGVASLGGAITESSSSSSPRDSAISESDANKRSKLTHASGLALVASASKHLTSMLTKTAASNEATRSISRAVEAAGFLLHGCPDAAEVQPLWDSLLGVHAISDSEDVLFTAGEAVAWAFGAVDGNVATVDDVLSREFKNLADSQRISSSPSATTSSSMDTSPPSTDTAKKSQALITSALFDTLVYSSKMSERRAGCIWLVSLIQYTDETSANLQAILSPAHDAFSELLGAEGGDELVIEMASRGLSLVYEKANESLKSQFVDGMMETLMHGKSKSRKRLVKLDENTVVFQADEGGIGSSQKLPDGEKTNLNTYKEICSLVTDVGQPDLLYKFLDLLHHQNTQNRQRGVAFSLQHIANRAQIDLSSHLASFVPKLYRMTHDPNAKVQESMRSIWAALLGEGAHKLVDEHLEAILAECTREMLNRSVWRNRESACRALADALVGRRFEEVESTLKLLWENSLKVRDDIKESVRLAAEALCRSLSNLTIRLCDPALTTNAEAVRKTTDIVLPILLDQALPNPAAEVRALGILTVEKLLKAARPEQVRSRLGDVCLALLESLSSLEDQRLNYLQQHVARAGLDESKLENLRISAASSSPMFESLDRCSSVLVDQESLDDVLQAVSTLARTGTGINTRAGTARFIVTLLRRFGSDAKSSANKVAQVFYTQMERERSAAVLRAYAGTVAAALSVAPKGRRAAFVDRLVAACDPATSDDATSDADTAAALVFRELSRGFADALSDFHSEVLPLAFVRKQESSASKRSEKEKHGSTNGGSGSGSSASSASEKARTAWSELWSELAGAESATVRVHAQEICAFCDKCMQSASWLTKAQGAAALADAASLAPAAIGEALAAQQSTAAKTLMSEAASSRHWEGKEEVFATLAALACADAGSRGAVPGAVKLCVSALASQKGERKHNVRREALSSLEALLANDEVSDDSCFGELVALLAPALQAGMDSSSSKGDGDEVKKGSSGDGVDGDGGDGKDSDNDKGAAHARSLAKLPAESICRVLALAYKRSRGVVPSAARDVASAIVPAADASRNWKCRSAALGTALAVVRGCFDDNDNDEVLDQLKGMGLAAASLEHEAHSEVQVAACELLAPYVQRGDDVALQTLKGLKENARSATVRQAAERNIVGQR